MFSALFVRNRSLNLRVVFVVAAWFISSGYAGIPIQNNSKFAVKVFAVIQRADQFGMPSITFAAPPIITPGTTAQALVDNMANAIDIQWTLYAKVNGRWSPHTVMLSRTNDNGVAGIIIDNKTNDKGEPVFCISLH